MPGLNYLSSPIFGLTVNHLMLGSIVFSRSLVPRARVANGGGGRRSEGASAFKFVGVQMAAGKEEGEA